MVGGVRCGEEDFGSYTHSWGHHPAVWATAEITIEFFSLKEFLRGHRSFQLLNKSAGFICFSDLIIWSFRSHLPLYAREPPQMMISSSALVRLLTRYTSTLIQARLFSWCFTVKLGNLKPSPLQGVFVFPQLNLREAHQSLCMCGYVCMCVCVIIAAWSAYYTLTTGSVSVESWGAAVCLLRWDDKMLK